MLGRTCPTWQTVTYTQSDEFRKEFNANLLGAGEFRKKSIPDDVNAKLRYVLVTYSLRTHYVPVTYSLRTRYVPVVD